MKISKWRIKKKGQTSTDIIIFHKDLLFQTDFLHRNFLDFRFVKILIINTSMYAEFEVPWIDQPMN